MNEQPTALRLADVLDRDPSDITGHKAAAELRRLHAEVEKQCRLNGMGSEREARLMAENEALRAALAEPEPPPEAQTEAEKLAYCAGWWDALAKARGAALEEPTGKQSLQVEPVTWKDKFYESLHHQDFGNSIPLYAAPPQRLPLTEEEIHSIFRTSGSPTAFARAIEAKHDIGSKT